MGSIPSVAEDCFGLIKLYSDGTISRFPVITSKNKVRDDTSILWKDRRFDNHHNLHVRLYKPAATATTSKLPILFYFHGGGFCFGSRSHPNFHNSALRLASGLQALVVQPDLRLAPEHRLPAAIDDAVNSVKWLKDQAKHAGDTWLSDDVVDFDRVFVVGDSSGGNIAHHLAVRLGTGSMEFRPVRVRGYVLLAPFFGGIIRSRSEEERPYEDFWSLDMYDSLPVMVQGVLSDNNPALQLEATTQFRKLLSIERSPPIGEIIKVGVVPRFVEFLDRHDLPQLQFEAAWALTNIASGTSEHTQVVIEHGAIPKFVKLLSSSSDDVWEQVVWALGNVAGDSPDCRDLVLSHGALMPLLAQLNEHSKLSMLRNATWTVSNFCRGKPSAPFEQVKPALPALQHLIYSSDEEVLTDACWALSYLSDGTNDKIQAVIEAGVCPQLVELLLHPSPTVLIPALRTVGNVVTGDDAQTQFVVDNQVLPCLYELLTQNHKKSIKKEVCWTISNITAGNTGQIQAVIEANIITPLVHLLQHAEFEIKKEAAWSISNATSGGSREQIQYMVSQGCIKPLCDLLLCPDPRIVTVCLEGLENILKVGETEKELGKSVVNMYAQMIDECDGLDKIENLQSHDNNEIYEKAVKILERYWIEEEEEEQNIQDGWDGSQAEFNAGTSQPNLPSGGFKFG